MSEEQVCKEIIEQVGYQEFYRYFQEKTTLIEQQKKEIERLHNIIKEVREYIEKASYLQGNKILEEKELLEMLDNKHIW